MDNEINMINDAVNSAPGTAIGLAMFGVGLMIFVFVIIIAMYVYMAICLMKIAKKTNTPNGWLAWIPIANFVLMVQIAKKPLWWLFILLAPFVPVVGPIAMLVVVVLIWMAIAERVGKEKWLGILMIVPIANLILPGILAFSKMENPEIKDAEIIEDKKKK